MRKITKTIAATTLAIFSLFAITSIFTPELTFAAVGSCDKANFVQSSIIGQDYEVDGQTLHGYCDDGKGGGVYAVLNIVLTVLTFGVGIAATAGLIICGIKYATSGTNETQATNARRRIFEIIIGLIAYAVMYLALQWLIPNFN